MYEQKYIKIYLILMNKKKLDKKQWKCVIDSGENENGQLKQKEKN